MAADDKKGGASTGAGSGGGTSSRKSPLSSGSRKPVTIDLPAKDVSKTDKPAASAGPAAKPAASKATSTKAGSVPPTGKQQSQSSAKPENTEATKTAAKPATGAKTATGAQSASTTAKPTAAASAKTAADEKKDAAASSTVKPSATKTTGASKTAAASKTSTTSAAKEPVKGKADKAGSGGKDTPPPPPPSGKGPGGPADKPPHPPKQGAGFGAMIAAGVIGALIVAGAGVGLHQVGMLQMIGAGSGQNATEVQALLESSKNRYSQLSQEITALKDHAAGSFAAKETIQNLTDQLDAIQKETSSKLSDATAGVTAKVQEQVSTLGAEIKELNELISNGAAGDGAAVASMKKTQDQLVKQVADLTAASRKNAEQVLKGMQGSLTDLQKQFQALKEAPTQLKDLSSQLAVTGSKVDEALAQIGKLTAEQKVLEGKIEALTQANAETTQQITARVDRLEKALGTASAQERAARAIAIASLRNAVDSGETYEAELAAVEAVLPGDAAELAPLKASAASGIPSSAALIAGFGKVARDMSAVSLTSENDDVVDRLFSSAKSLVSVRTPTDSDGTSSGELLGTMESRVSAGDLAGAIKAYDALPEPMQQVGAAWAEQVKARLAADELVKKITAQVLKSLVSENK
ncbi:phage tail protein [Pseudovibrio sp. Alg231-02]|uniref:phage tail protein n=1 Tax=Pseudovibrio sp. Alg231-02 TaxID=1922223 RepID=UPI000D552E95|nr:phage tail protein [Pseudovibrio sp. Alg231-02]